MNEAQSSQRSGVDWPSRYFNLKGACKTKTLDDELTRPVCENIYLDYHYYNYDYYIDYYEKYGCPGTSFCEKRNFFQNWPYRMDHTCIIYGAEAVSSILCLFFISLFFITKYESFFHPDRDSKLSLFVAFIHLNLAAERGEVQIAHSYLVWTKFENNLVIIWEKIEF